MNEIRIGSRGDTLVLSPDESTGYITVRLESGRLRSETRPRDQYDLRGLADYVADLADAALVGWEGAKGWESLEGDIRLQASLRQGHVTINATLREERVDPANHGWSAQLDITVDPGEELRQYASQARHLLEAV